MAINNRVWELPLGQPPELELQTDFGAVSIAPVESGAPARIELSERSADHVTVRVEKQGDVARVRLEPMHGFHWFGGWDCQATLYVPRNVRAHVQTSAGKVSVRDLEGCELGIKASAGKIDLTNVHGLLHLAADAGSISGRDVGGFLDVQTQAGSVRLEISQLRPGEHRIRASMGSVRLELARGLDVAIETHSSMGSVRSTYPAGQTGAAKLVLTTDMGSIRVDEAPSLEPHTPRTPVDQVPPRERATDPEVERVLKMVESGELSAQDADELLRALDRA